MGLSSELQAFVDVATTSSVSDVLMKRGIHGYMRQRIRPLDMKSKVFGPALTVERLSLRALPQERRKPNAALIDAIEAAPAGTVLVFNGDPEHEAALWGGLMAAAGHRNKLGGVVADGPIRDPLEIMELAQPCFAPAASRADRPASWRCRASASRWIAAGYGFTPAISSSATAMAWSSSPKGSR